MLRIAYSLEAQLHAAMGRAFPDAAAEARAAGRRLDPQLAPASKPEFGDFQANGALPLAKPLGQPPRKIAQAVVEQLKADPAFAELCLEPEIAGPGFINLTLKPERLAAGVQARLGDPRLGVPAVEQTAPVNTHGEASPILGLEGLEYRLGGCCSPLPGEAIVGTVGLGNHGITIHRQDCSNLSSVPVERRLPVQWNPQAADALRRRYPVQLRIEVLDRVGVLKDILTRLSDQRINVSDARVRTNPGKPARIDLRVELQSAHQLRDTLDQIRSMADVLDIARTGIGS